MDTTEEPKKMTSEQWKDWLLNERCISLAVAREAGLTVHDDELEIPVRDASGNHLFSKFRRSPLSVDGPKYRYEFGSTASLFGAEQLSSLQKGETVLVVEGELDALALRTLDFHAVSSTGGAMTWRPEWTEQLSSFEVIFMYDADQAGVHGSLRAAGLTPGAKVAWLPVAYGKDPTEVIRSNRVDELEGAIASAREYALPHPGECASVRLEAYREAAEKLKIERFEQNQSPTGTPFHQDLALLWLEDRIKDAREGLDKARRKPTSESASEVEKAKTYPIRELVKVNHSGFAKCIFHEENSASMKVYQDNHAYSYCCGKRSDVLDIYQTLNSCSFKEAVSRLAN